jgi:hypothetical protein
VDTYFHASVAELYTPPPFPGGILGVLVDLGFLLGFQVEFLIGIPGILRMDQES